MNLVSIILAAVLGIAVIAAVRSMWKHRDQGGCSGNCSSCSQCRKISCSKK